ncbi:MAG: ABC transporter ATP-binding protein [Bacteroidetes bacterium]|nr:ABC transporter ATP-binding protein [Bacteroidota bacterium]
MENIFILEKIKYTYQDSAKTVLHDISLQIPKGLITSLLGPNGSGKTTLIDILLGWKKPNTGTVLVKGKNLSTYSRRERSKLISLVPQNEPLQFAFTLLDYVLFGRAPYLPQLGLPGKKDIEIAYEALETVGLQDLHTRSITSLSGGERQLIMLARSLAQQPEILLLDEPTSSLDPGNTEKVLNILQGLGKRGLTILYSTHDPSSAAYIADYIIMLREGRNFLADKAINLLTGKNLTDLYGAKLKVINKNDSIIIYRESN